MHFVIILITSENMKLYTNTLLYYDVYLKRAKVKNKSLIQKNEIFTRIHPSWFVTLEYTPGALA